MDQSRGPFPWFGAAADPSPGTCLFSLGINGSIQATDWA